MLNTRLLISGLIALGLALAPTGVLAAGTHAHDATVKIKLDHGKKWPTDAALRRGMGDIRTDAGAAQLVDRLLDRMKPGRNVQRRQAQSQ